MKHFLQIYEALRNVRTCTNHGCPGLFSLFSLMTAIASEASLSERTFSSPGWKIKINNKLNQFTNIINKNKFDI